MSTGAGASGAAAAAAIAQAIKASGAIVKVEPNDFMTIIDRQDEPLIVQSEAGVFGTVYRYLTSYKGLAFYTQTSRKLHLPGTAELVLAKKIWIP